MNTANTVFLRSGCHLVWLCFSITTNIRKKIAETEEQEYLMHSWQECSDVFSKSPVYARQHLVSICIIKRQTGLHLQLCNTNMVSEHSQQRGHIPGAQSWLNTFSNSFFPADYFCRTTEWRGHGWDIRVPWRPHSLSAAGTGCSNFCCGTGLDRESWGQACAFWRSTLCCCLAAAGNVGHGGLLRMQTSTVLVEERLISVYDCVCKSCQKFMSNNSVAPPDVSRN